MKNLNNFIFILSKVKNNNKTEKKLSSSHILAYFYIIWIQLISNVSVTFDFITMKTMVFLVHHRILSEVLSLITVDCFFFRLFLTTRPQYRIILINVSCLMCTRLSLAVMKLKFIIIFFFSFSRFMNTRFNHLFIFM